MRRREFITLLGGTARRVAARGARAADGPQAAARRFDLRYGSGCGRQEQAHDHEGNKASMHG